MRILGVLTSVVLLLGGAQAWAQAPAEEEAPNSNAGTGQEAPPAGDEAAAVAAPAESEADPAVDTTAASTAGEVKALEADMKAAHDKVEAGEGAATPQPTAGFEEIKAAPVGGASAAAAPGDSAAGEQMTAAEARLTGTVGLDSDRPYGALVVLDHSFGTGNFIADATNRERYDYVVQSWDIRPHYIFNVADHKLKLMARLLLELEYTQPDTNPSRRFRPADVSLYLSDAQLYKEPLTGVSFNAGGRVFFPTSWESINVKRQWTGFSLSGGARRSFGPLMLSYGLSFTKYFNGTKVPMGWSDVAREGDPVAITSTRADDPSGLPNGFANTSFAFINTFDVSYTVTDNLSVSYSVAIWNTFKYDISEVDPDGKYSGEYGQDGRGRTDSLWPTFDVSYTMDELIKPAVELPFSLTLSAGLTALHPAQSDDNKEINWPLFYHSFAKNRAANNYGSIYVDLVGIY